MSRDVDGIVLGTVNAPWKRSISAEDLSHCVATTLLDAWLPHVAVFYTEVPTNLVMEFAEAHGISRAQLSKSYIELKQRTSETNKLLESILKL